MRTRRVFAVCVDGGEDAAATFSPRRVFVVCVDGGEDAAATFSPRRVFAVCVDGGEDVAATLFAEYGGMTWARNISRQSFVPSVLCCLPSRFYEENVP